MPAVPAIAACALLCLVIFARVPGDGLFASELTNAAHGPAFALLTWLLFRIVRAGPLHRTSLLLQYTLTVCGAIALGAAVELLQAMLGRDASWEDLLRDAQGTLAATGWLLMRDTRLVGLRRERGTRLAGLAAAIAGTAMIAWPPVVSGLARLERDRNFPVLADFGRPRTMHFVNPLGGATVEWAPLPEVLVSNAVQSHGLRVATASHAWWGVMLRDLVPDWRPYRRICVTLSNPSQEPLSVELRLHDRRLHVEAATSVRTSLNVAPRSSQTFRLPFAAMNDAADLDLAQVQSLMLARKGPRREATEFYVTRLWLE